MALGELRRAAYRKSCSLHLGIREASQSGDLGADGSLPFEVRGAVRD